LHAPKGSQYVLAYQPINSSPVDLRQLAKIGDFHGLLLPLQIGYLDVSRAQYNIGIKSQSSVIHSRSLQLNR
jgi:hypothetical protein